KVFESGNTAIKIFNGLDFNDFFIETEIENRNSTTIMMLYHDSPAKGCKEGLTALRIIKERIKGLKVILYGVPKKPKKLEDWIEYHRMPSREKLRNLYNQSAIFLSPSHSEGWGLPVAEAMQCGCMVVTSDIEGFNDFVKNKDTGICFKVKDVNDMIEKLLIAINNKALRISIAQQGNVYIKNFTWDIALNKMVTLLNELK
ncbi:MAG: glycosyltransferase, partial [Rickettsiales bacterium]